MPILLTGFIIIILNPSMTLVNSHETIYIRPAQNATSCSNTMTTTSCLTLSEYLQIFKAMSVTQPTTLMFFPGDDYLSETWVIQGLNVQFLLQGQLSSRLHLDTLHFLMVEDSTNIEIHSLEFILNTNFLPITGTTAAAIQCQSCIVSITDVTFVGRSRALYAYSSSIITFTGRNIFEGNVAEQGGAIYSLDK